MQIEALHTEPWFQYLARELQALVESSFILQQRAGEIEPALTDYSYVVFPFSKAYEGFLKQLFLDLHLIDSPIYADTFFRIGRALNPDVRPQQRDQHWLFDDILRLCGKETADLLWEAWLECRNHIFHYFPGRHQLINLEQARSCQDMLVAAMKAGVACKK